jgi:hypothetical protein
MLERIKNNFGLNDEKWVQYLSCFQRMEVMAKTVVLPESEILKKMFFVRKGLLACLV